MLNFWSSAAGVYLVELTAGDLADSLRSLNQAGIPLSQVEYLDLLTARFQIPRGKRRLLQAIADKRGDGLKIIKPLGIYWPLRRLLTRPVLSLGLLAVVGFFLFLPSRVLFFSVEGNEAVPSARILDCARDCGIHFFMQRREIRSEALKNGLLEKLPELKWAGINTKGSTAVIQVRERETGQLPPQGLKIASVVAACDGVITKAHAERGNLLCRPGQAVTRGQVLISGYIDNGHRIRATQAKGEIYGQTARVFRAVTPEVRLVRDGNREKTRGFSLLLGKKRIKLWAGSGNMDASCGRMYEEYYITLPGGYVLPVALCIDTWETASLRRENRPPEEVRENLQSFAGQSLQKKMIAGEILTGEEKIHCRDGLYILEGKYLCHEMIGRQRQEQIGE